MTPAKFSASIDFLLTDIDDTITTDGALEAEAFTALWQLKQAGIKVIPVTGRPAGWCDMITRFWPVEAVIGENGAFIFRYDRQSKKMHRQFLSSDGERAEQKLKLKKIEKEILAQVPDSAVSSDQFCRISDLAIDFCEDIPALKPEQVKQIQKIFEAHGCVAKISSIHVNGWFGNFTKLSTALDLLRTHFSLTDLQIQKSCAFVGDSLNDEPMWSHFQNSLAVANVKNFWSQLQDKPKFVSAKSGGEGFVEWSKRLIELKNKPSPRI